MKFMISIFFMAGSLTMIQMLDSALTSKNPRKMQQEKKLLLESEEQKLSVVPKRPPFNDEGPGGIGGVPPTPNQRISKL